MSYGLYDGDMRFYGEVPFFNLELMKLSSYYKRRREMVSLSPSFNPNLYTHFIVRQDSLFPNSDIKSVNNVSYGGRAFDGEKYKPLPLEIEVMRPDIELYNRIEASHTALKKSSLSTMRRAEHLRLSLDGKTIWNDFEKQLRYESRRYGIIFHDYDLNELDDALNIVKDLLLEVFPTPSPRRVGMKYPVQLNSEEELVEWASLPPMGSYFYLQLNGIPTLKNIERLRELSRGTSALKQTSMNVTKNQNYETFIKTGIIELFEHILDLRRDRINFPLIFDKAFFVDSRWAEVLQLIKLFNNYIGNSILYNDYYKRVAPYESFYDFMKGRTKEHILFGSALSKTKVQELFQFVRENNYDLFVDFYEYYGEKR